MASVKSYSRSSMAVSSAGKNSSRTSRFALATWSSCPNRNVGTLRNIAIRFDVAFVAAAATAVPSLATAQEWSLQSGATARAEYSDNYFFTAGRV